MMGSELELKLAFTKPMGVERVCDCLQAHFGLAELRYQRMRNRYFDTPDQALNRARIALRIRDCDGQYIQTLKTKGVTLNGVHRRGEWEWPLGRPELDPALLNTVQTWPREIDVELLGPVFETNFERRSALIAFQGSTLELAFDHGEVQAGGRSAPICELELELLQGNAEVLSELGRELCALLPLAPSDVSKAEAAIGLLGAAVPASG
jgi:inorganic triphosphatase YgiF